MRAALVERDFGEPTARANPGLVAPETNREATITKHLQLDFFLVESTEAQPGATDRHREAPMRLNSNTPKNGHFPAGGSVHRYSCSSKEFVIFNERKLHEISMKLQVAIFVTIQKPEIRGGGASS